ncbi:MAG: hypothetical protein Q9220_001636 [cf. Caloplaca sp. 1 TL-2023]
MSPADTVQDPYLKSVLATSNHTQLQCIQLVDLAERSAVPSSQSMSTDTKLQLSHQQRQLNADLGKLRHASRESIFEVRMTKQHTAEARQEIDRLHLQLQNLYYEERHLRGEIFACESYDHQYQQLPLIPVEDFLQLQPEHLNGDEKSLMFARINHEHAEREALEQQRQELLKKKQGLIAENKKRREDLASLDKDLETFIDAAKPIQKLFEAQY